VDHISSNHGFDIPKTFSWFIWSTRNWYSKNDWKMVGRKQYDIRSGEILERETPRTIARRITGRQDPVHTRQDALYSRKKPVLSQGFQPPLGGN
jgi:hypothetical protein